MSSAVASDVGYADLKFFGRVAIISKPYYVNPDNGQQIALGLRSENYDQVNGIKNWCSKFLNLDLRQVLSFGMKIGMQAGDLAIFSSSQNYISIHSNQYQNINSLDIIYCEVDIPNANPIVGDKTELPNGTVKIDQPKFGFENTSYPIQLSIESEAKNLCHFNGFSDLEEATFSLKKRDENVLSIRAIRNAVNLITIETNMINPKNYNGLLILESLTCVK